VDGQAHIPTASTPGEKIGTNFTGGGGGLAQGQSGRVRNPYLCNDFECSDIQPLLRGTSSSAQDRM